MGISHLNGLRLHGSVEQDVMQMVEATLFSIEDPTETSENHLMSLSKSTKLVLKYLRELYTRLSSLCYVSCQSFIAIKLRSTNGFSRSVKACF